MVDVIAIIQPNDAKQAFAEAGGAFDNCIEHWLRVSWRPADDVEDFACGSLMFECFGQGPRARLYFIEQPHVLDRDHRLVGTGSGKLDLSLGEWAQRLACQSDDAERNSFAEAR